MTDTKQPDDRESTDTDGPVHADDLPPVEPTNPQDLELAHFASIFPTSQPVHPELAAAVQQLEQVLEMPVWLMIQPHAHHPLASVDEPVQAGFYAARKEIKDDNPVALVIDSPGGSARAAYEIARLFQRRASRFVVVVPRYAKSAATLLSLGADDLIMGPDAELGPLDAQLFDLDQEEWASALDEVQALERLNVAALEQVDQAMMMLVSRTGKKIDTLVPHAMKYATDMMRPLLENIDTVHYIKQSRVLKVGEDYAVRLLGRRLDWAQAQSVASQFVSGYSEHGFVIDRDEATVILELAPVDDAVEKVVDSLSEVLMGNSDTVIGRLVREGQNDSE